MGIPELSIIMPVFNSERYIGEAVNSLLSQNYTDFELIIVDDASTDGSLQVVKSFDDNRIKIITNDRNRGIVFSRNRGLLEATGRFISPFDADDVAMHEKFSLQMGFLKKNPAYGMIGSWGRMINEEGKLLKQKWKLNASPEKIPAILLFRNYFLQPSIVIRREAIPKDGYSEGYDIGEDYKMWFEVARRFNVWNYPEYLVRIRIHKQSTTRGDTERLHRYDAKVYRYLFKPLEIELDDHLVSLLLLIKNDEQILLPESLEEIEALLLLILDQNRKLGIYDQKQLRKVVLNRWVKACNKARRLHFKMAARFLNSPLLKLYSAS